MNVQSLLITIYKCHWKWKEANFRAPLLSLHFIQILSKNGGRAGNCDGLVSFHQEDRQVANSDNVHQRHGNHRQAGVQDWRRQACLSFNCSCFNCHVAICYFWWSQSSPTLSDEEGQGKCSGSSAQGIPGFAFPRRWLQCCTGSYCPSTSTTTSTSSLSKGGEPPSHVDCEQEGWLPAHLLPAGRGWRSTSQAHF